METMDTSGTIFETREEKETRLQAQKLAAWAAEVEVAKKANPAQCQEKVYGSGRYVHGCTKPAKFHREENVVWDVNSPMVVRHYCGTHDPVTKRERKNKKHEEETRTRSAKYAMEDRRDLINRVVGHLTNEQLVELESFLPSTPFAKKS